MNDSIISYWRDARGASRGVTALVLTAFIWMQMYPVAAAAEDAIEGNSAGAATTVSASFNHSKANAPTNVDPQRATMEALSKTLSGMHAALKKHRDLIVKRKDKKGNLHITIIGTKADVDLTDARKTIVQIKQKIALQDAETQISFEHDAERIKTHNLPAIIQQRYDKALEKYQKNREDFEKGLDVILSGRDLDALINQIDVLQKKTAENLPQRSKFDPNNLPFRIADPKVREPATTPEALKNILAGKQLQPTLDISKRKQEITETEVAQIRKGSEEGQAYAIPRDPIRVAANGSMSGMLAMADVVPPGSEYLAPTEDVQITPAIQGKAIELHNNPVEIYDWVHDNIEYLPTYGSIQGADMALQTKRGNAFDTSSLLIALLRASGIPARYAYGTIDIPIDKVMNWVGGVTDPTAAQQLLGQGGIPNIGLTQGGKIFAIRMEHIWVEAFVDAYPSKGTKNKTADAWVPMDGAFKQYVYTQGMNLQKNLPFDVDGFNAQIRSDAQVNDAEGWAQGVNEAHIAQTLTAEQQRMNSYVASQSGDATVSQVFGAVTIISTAANSLAAGLPYRIVAVGNKYSNLTGQLRRLLRIELFDSASAAANDAASTVIEHGIAYFSGKKIGLNYVPSTSADQAVIDEAASRYSTTYPAYQVNEKLSISADGVVEKTGADAAVGSDQVLRVSVISPNGNQSSDYPLIVGDSMILSLDPAGTPLDVFTARSRAFDTGSLPSASDVSELFHQAGLAYWAEEEGFANLIARQMGVVNVVLPSHGLLGASIGVVYSYGVPKSATYKNRIVDLKHISVAAVDVTNDKSNQLRFLSKKGYISSYLESGIYEQAFLLPQGLSMSAATALVEANRQGIRIYHVTSANAGTAVTNLQQSQAVMADVQSALSSNLEVDIPQREIQIADFRGVGYVFTDPQTGSASYRISGGRNGNNSPAPASVYPVPQPESALLLGLMAGSSLRNAAAKLAVDTAGAIRGIDIPAPRAGESPLTFIAALVVTLAVAAVLSKEIDEKYPPTHRILRHYTSNNDAFLSILAVSYIRPSGVGADFGPGVYFANPMEPPNNSYTCPPTPDQSLAVARAYNIPSSASPDPQRATAYIELDFTRENFWKIVPNPNENGVTEYVVLSPGVYYGVYAFGVEFHASCPYSPS